MVIYIKKNISNSLIDLSEQGKCQENCLWKGQNGPKLQKIFLFKMEKKMFIRKQHVWAFTYMVTYNIYYMVYVVADSGFF